MRTQDKINGIMDYVKENLYHCLDDIVVNDQTFNSNLLFEVLTYLNNGNQLLFGEYGFGKTTSAENITGLLDGLPRETVVSSEIQGHPEQTEEKTIARPDLGKLNNGDEEVLWSYFVLSPSKIIDEINRLPPSKQNIIVDGIETGNWKYLSSFIQNGEFPLYSTCNYADSGNNELIEPILDRFDIATESKRPGLEGFVTIKDTPKDVKNILADKDISNRIFEIYNSKELSFEEKTERVNAVKSEYKRRIEEKTGIDLLSDEEINKSREEIDSMEFSEKAEMFYSFTMSELISCQSKGMKRANETCENGCHFLDYACGKTENGVSVRTALATANYARSLAWLNGKEEVTIEEVECVLPYTMWHKVEFKDGYMSKFKDEERTDPLQLYTAKQLVGEIKERFNEQENMLTNYICMRRDGKDKEASDYVAEADHPVFKEFERQSWLK